MFAPATLLICVATFIVTWRAFFDEPLRDRLLFRPQNILAHKEWYRLVSSALIHADWMHVGFNLYALYSFGTALELSWGTSVLVLIYGTSVLGGSLLSLFLHRFHDYAALGASGGVCGVIFATIFLLPGTAVNLFFLPTGIPGPIFAVLYLVGTFVALRRGIGNIGHDAHFGGAVAGLLWALVFAPHNCLASPVLFGLAVLVALGGLLVLARDPFQIPGRLPLFNQPQFRPNLRYQRYDESRIRRQTQIEIDRILDKVSAQGLDSLTPGERATLEASSARSRRD
jgi:membrane associated rhomboid family serine protease